MREGDFDQLPLTRYLDGTLPISDLLWKTEMDLQPGTVLLFSHDQHERAFIFESLEQTSSKFANGLLTILDGTDVIDARQRATLRLIHPPVLLAQTNRPYVEFHFPIQEGKLRRMVPAVNCYETMYSEDLAQLVRRARIAEQLMKPLEGGVAQSVIRALINLYLHNASSDLDKVKGFKSWQVADRLRQDFTQSSHDTVANSHYL